MSKHFNSPGPGSVTRSAGEFPFGAVPRSELGVSLTRSSAETPRLFVQWLATFASVMVCIALGAPSHAKEGAALDSTGREPEPRLLLKAPDVSQDEFEAYVQANGYRTLSQSLELNRPQEAMSQRLNDLIAKGQMHWLEGATDEARASFQSAASLTLQDDWRPAQREALQYALLRLAQTSATPSEKETWLKQAATEFHDVQIDESLFPPPLLDAYKEILSRALTKAQVLSLSMVFPHHTSILINGAKHLITPKLRVRLPPGRHRLTALSDSHAPVSEILSTDQMAVMQLRTNALLGGSCLSPSASHVNELGVRHFGALYQGNCLRWRDELGWATNTDGDPMDLALSPVAAKTTSSLESSLNRVDGSSEARTKKIRRHWLWLGASVLAAGTAYVIYRETQNSSGDVRMEPVHRQGF